MKGNYDKQHRLALHNPYGSVVKVLDAKEDDLLVGIKNVASIPNTLMHKLEPHGFSLHTIDKKSQLDLQAVIFYQLYEVKIHEVQVCASTYLESMLRS